MFYVALHGYPHRVRRTAEKIYQDFTSRECWQTLMGAKEAFTADWTCKRH